MLPHPSSRLPVRSGLLQDLLEARADPNVRDASASRRGCLDVAAQSTHREVQDALTAGVACRIGWMVVAVGGRGWWGGWE